MSEFDQSRMSATGRKRQLELVRRRSGKSAKQTLNQVAANDCNADKVRFRCGCTKVGF
ncbi:hypothetical protein RUA4292_02988 [Ruegeria atlantica]|uniref:Uncharacterized protein n=1 Tax=Ruegeria atlantica TaxID=81569 RepID=A0A0P1F1I9_9RHOB|nr:hypothetical protein RUA4292_02988 [Ruegeria atlantica]